MVLADDLTMTGTEEIPLDAVYLTIATFAFRNAPRIYTSLVRAASPDWVPPFSMPQQACNQRQHLGHGMDYISSLWQQHRDAPLPQLSRTSGRIADHPVPPLLHATAWIGSNKTAGQAAANAGYGANLSRARVVVICQNRGRGQAPARTRTSRSPTGMNVYPSIAASRAFQLRP